MISDFAPKNHAKHLIVCQTFETLNDRLPHKYNSDRPQTLPKPVSDDPRHFIFRGGTKFFRRIVDPKNKVFLYFSQVFEEQ